MLTAIRTVADKLVVIEPLAEKFRYQGWILDESLQWVALPIE